jgi:hypothetical protein
MLTMPCCFGHAPVPIVVWIAGVTEGEDPMVASVIEAPPSIISAMKGQSSGH